MGQGVTHVAAAHPGRGSRRRLEQGAGRRQRRTTTRSTAIPILQHQLTTVGSVAVTGYYEKLRLAGAQARKVLHRQCGGRPGTCRSRSSPPSRAWSCTPSRAASISYGEIAKTATVPDPLPEVTKADLKPSSQFRLIGKDIGRVDVPPKVNGTAQYGIDIAAARTCSTPRCCTRRCKARSRSRSTIRRRRPIKGIVKIVPLPSGVGVIGETVEATMKAKAALKVTWSNDAGADL